MPFSNIDKLKHGQSSQKGLQEILTQYETAGYISQLVQNHRAGREGYSNTEQFYAPFLICFPDKTKWVLYSTTSMRTDRIKGQQWDALNLKEIDSNITKAYIVYPDGMDDRICNEFIRQNQKYQSNDEYSKIDGIVSQVEICKLIEAYALKDIDKGKRNHLLGNNFEDRVAKILNYTANLEKMQTNSETTEGMHFGLFSTILSSFGVDVNSIKSIHATSDKEIIGKLPSGGNPKTDVLVFVTHNNGEKEFYTISCKRSSEQTVGVHQFSANAFADVLNPEDNNLRVLLNGFQEAGSISKFGEERKQQLTHALQPYLEKLALWVLGGYGGEGNEKQCAQYILTYKNDTDSVSIHTIKYYYESLLAAGVHGNFGTIFSWTYPSKMRGKNIKLKCQII